MQLNDVLEEVDQRLGHRPEPEVLTLTEKNGFVSQRQRFSKRLAVEDTSDYKVVRRFDIAFNPYLLWAGAIAQNVDWNEGIVSPLYPTFRVRDEYHPRFIHHLLRSPPMMASYDRIAFGSVPRKRRTAVRDFLALPVPESPPIPEQRRIAAILDEADVLRDKRRVALAQFDIVCESIFLDMFGDPSDLGWPKTTIERAAENSSGSIRTGPFGSQLLHSEFTDTGVAVLGIDNVVHNEFRWGARRYISEAKYAGLRRYTVRPGDVLISIMGTCGRCAIVPDDVPVAINTKHLCCITLDQHRFLPEFVHGYFLMHPDSRRYLDRTTKGAIMGGLNMGIIEQMPLFVPPMELQREFVRHLNAVKQIKEEMVHSREKLDTLFASLQHRAFRGEL